MPVDCSCIFSLVLRRFYSTEIKPDSGLWVPKFSPTYCLPCNAALNTILILVVCQRGSPSKETKKKPVNGPFHEEHHDNKQCACKHRKWEMLSPAVPVSLASACRGKERKIYKDATLWSAACAAGEPGKETKTAIQSHWRTAIVLSVCTEKPIGFRF